MLNPILHLSIIAMVLATTTSNATGQVPTYGSPVYRGDIESSKLNHISGLEPSQKYPGLYWAHNDRDSEVYALDVNGKHVATIDITNTRNADWEDMTSFKLNGDQYLLFADVGGNKEERDDYDLVGIKAPERDLKTNEFPTKIPADLKIRFKYPSGGKRVNCEAVAVDSKNNLILLLTKERSDDRASKLYSLPLFTTSPKSTQTPKFLGNVNSIVNATRDEPMRRSKPTSLDISADGSLAVVLTYCHAYTFARNPKDNWFATFSAAPTSVIKLPYMVQPEAICFQTQSDSIVVTSERGERDNRRRSRKAPIFEIPTKGKQPNN